ncbi:MAG: hypothetical protein ACLU9X_10220 [Alistipes shahii]
MKKALKRMAAAALVTLSVLRGGDAFAQNAVDGRVVDANGAPLVGVTVLIKGRSRERPRAPTAATRSRPGRTRRWSSPIWATRPSRSMSANARRSTSR